MHLLRDGSLLRLSGFLIGSILLRSANQAGVAHLRRFYLRRVFRTFPSYYLVLTVLAVAFPLTAHQRHHLPLEYIYGTNFLPLDRGQMRDVLGMVAGAGGAVLPFGAAALPGAARLRGDRVRIVMLTALMAVARW